MFNLFHWLLIYILNVCFLFPCTELCISLELVFFNISLGKWEKANMNSICLNLENIHENTVYKSKTIRMSLKVCLITFFYSGMLLVH